MKRDECKTKIMKILDWFNAEYPDLTLRGYRSILADDLVSFINSEWGLEKD